MNVESEKEITICVEMEGGNTKNVRVEYELKVRKKEIENYECGD